MSLFDLEHDDAFASRHIGVVDPADTQRMLDAIGFGSLEELLDAAVPETIRDRRPLALPPATSEAEVAGELRELAGRNRVLTSMIGLGYYGTITPAVIRRNVLENPAWYTAYTPYQPEISQGRLEALLNFQTVIEDLTALPVANASLLDESTAAAEAMALMHRAAPQGDTLVVDADVLPQTLDVVRTRARPLGLQVVTHDLDDPLPDGDVFGVLVQYPGASGRVRDLAPIVTAAHDRGALVTVAADLLGLTLLVPPGEVGADIAVGTSQRFGVPLGFGGPHAGYMAIRSGLERQLPGRLGRRLDRRRRPARLPARLADPRAAHPARKRHEQHLHRAGATRRDRRHVRRLPRRRRHPAHRTARAPHGGDPGGGSARGRRRGFQRAVLRHRDRARARALRRRWWRPRSSKASTCDSSTPTPWASPATRRPTGTTSSPSGGRSA